MYYQAEHSSLKPVLLLADDSKKEILGENESISNLSTSL